MYSFPNLEPVHCSMSSTKCCFLTCIQFSQEAGKVVWCSRLFNNFTLIVMIHTVKGFSIIKEAAAAAANSLQLCLTLFSPTDGSPPGSPVPGILQARTLEWVAIFSSNAWKWKVKVKSLSRVWLIATPWTAADPAPPSMGFSRQEYWSGVPLPSLQWSRSRCFPGILLLFLWSNRCW